MKKKYGLKKTGILGQLIVEFCLRFPA